jgi:signal peptidase II
MPVLGRLGLVIVAVALLVLLDLSTKGWATGTLRPAGGRTVAGGQVRLQYHENPGIAFGLLRDTGGAGSAGADRRQRGIVAYSAAASLVLTGLLVWLTLRQDRRRGGGAAVVVALACAGLAALLAGTLGNLHDRLERGYVIDFIDLSAGGWLRWPIFNIADLAIALGMAMCAAALIAGWVRRIRRARAGLFLDDEDEEAQDPVPDAAATAGSSDEALAAAATARPDPGRDALRP